MRKGEAALFESRPVASRRISDHFVPTRCPQGAIAQAWRTSLAAPLDAGEALPHARISAARWTTRRTRATTGQQTGSPVGGSASRNTNRMWERPRPGPGICRCASGLVSDRGVAVPITPHRRPPTVVVGECVAVIKPEETGGGLVLRRLLFDEDDQVAHPRGDPWGISAMACSTISRSAPISTGHNSIEEGDGKHRAQRGPT